MVPKLTDNEIAKQTAAARRAAIREMREPWWPVACQYRGGAVHVLLRGGMTTSFPVAFLDPKLKDASPAALRTVELIGEGLHWEGLDVDVSLPGAVTEALGPAFICREAGRIAGRRGSHRKAEAARANGAQGGRPPRKVRRRPG